MRVQIHAHDLQLRPEVLSRIERHLQDAFLSNASRLSGVTLHLTTGQGTPREFTCRLLVHLNRSDDVVVTDRDERLTVLLKRATRTASAAVRKRLRRRRDLRRRRRQALRPLTVA